MTSNNQVSPVIRISQGERDASARATHLKAASRKYLETTIERKQMSTTTNFKRIALVAVAALGLGVLSSVPSQAVVNNSQLTLSATTGAQTTAETVTATNPTITLSGLMGVTADSISVTASLDSAPTGATALPYLQLTETSSALVNDTGTTGAGYDNALLSFVNPNTVVNVSAGTITAATAVSAKFKVFLGTSTTAAPTVVGDYVVRLTPAVSAGSTTAMVAQTIKITVTAAPALDKTATAANSTSVISIGDTVTTTNGDNAVDDVVYAPKGSTTAANTTIRALIKVTQKNAAASTNASESMTVTVSGPGVIAVATPAATYTATNAGARALTVKNGDVVAVYSDGSSGVGKITIATATTTLATETVNFYGAIASVVATVVSPVIGIGAASATVGNVAYANTGAVYAIAKDAQGFTVCDSATSLYLTSGTTTIISNSYTGVAPTAAATTVFPACSYRFDLTGVAAGSASLTVGSGSSAAATTNITAPAVSVRVASSTAANVTISFDKATYAPGEAATVSVKAVDATGAVLAGQYLTGIWAIGGITSDYALTGDTLTWTEVRSSTATGIATYKVFMPQIDGKVTLTGTTGTGLSVVANQAVKVTASATVTSPGAQALAAVTALATTVASLRTLIVTLTNLVLKIQKKVKA